MWELSILYNVLGSFEQCAEESLVLKRFCQLEHAAFTKLFNDPLRAFVPKYHGMTTKGGNRILFIGLVL